MKDGQKRMRLKFYIEGSEPGLRGIVHTDSQEVKLKAPYMLLCIHNYLLVKNRIHLQFYQVTW